MPSIAFHTLGCKLNFAESSHLLRTFKQQGYKEKSFHEVADVYVINTCTVTATAEKKCRAAIRQANKLNSQSVIAVIGCFPQVNAKEIEKIEGVDIILGNDDKNKLFEKVNQCLEDRKFVNEVVDIKNLRYFSPSFSSDDRTRGFLKVQDGCDYFCSYCEIPYARGRSRSCSIKEAVRYAQLLEGEGKKEIILTGINIGDFGKGTSENFLGLLRALDSQTTVARYRISSIEPDLLTADIINFCASSQKIAPHFHIPLQSASNTVLKSMKRNYTCEEFSYKVRQIKTLIPDAFIACDVMCGFNTETEDEFKKSYDILSNLPISFLHVFTYSERPDANTARIGKKVPMAERRKRTEIMQSLSEEKKKEFYLSQVGKQVSVLWEEANKNGKMYGFSENYVRCQTDYNKDLRNKITKHALYNFNTLENIFEV